MVFINILRRQKEKLLGVSQVSVDIKDPEQDDILEEKLRFSKASFNICVYTFVALLFALMCTSIIFYIYGEYRAEENHFRGRCGVNFDDIVMDQVMAEQMKYSMEEQRRDDEIDSVFHDMLNFEEDFDIYLDDGHAKITVPDFRDGRSGQFIHDFNNNITAIIDSEGQRCFTMPLDREAVLPPRSLVDMVMKMMNGYYNVNMNLVKQNMVVVIPPITDFKKVGTLIQMECGRYPIYQLEKQTHAISKRSADTVPAKFREFAGNNLQEFDILNFDDIVKYEKELKTISS